MAKSIFLLVFLLASFTLCSQTITGKYVLQKVSGIGEDGKLTNKAKVPEFYEYTCSNNTSSLVLLTKGGTYRDTLNKDDRYNTNYKTVETTITYSDYILIKYLDTGKFEKKYILENKETLINDNLPKLSWIITKEKKMIEGFKCTRAITGYTTFGVALKVEAWFCDIAVNDGPFEFCGLPGLILELSANNLFTVHLTDITYDKLKSTDIAGITSSETPKTIKELEKEFRDK